MLDEVEGRSVRVDGRVGTITSLYWEGREFVGALVRFDDYVPGEAYMALIETQQRLEECLCPQPDETAREPEPAMESEDGEEDPSPGEDVDANGLPFARSPIDGVPLPIYGDRDEQYVKGSTGNWYSKEMAIRAHDVDLVTWIDRRYARNSVWPVEYLVDDALKEYLIDDVPTIVPVYLVKFEGYELNPGVAGNSNNPGDWYSVEENIPQNLLNEYLAWKAAAAQQH